MNHRQAWWGWRGRAAIAFAMMALVSGAAPVWGQARLRLPRASGAIRVDVVTDAREYVAWTPDDVEPMRVRVTADADGYLILLSGGTGSRLTVLAPNDLLAELPVRAGVPVEFPPTEWLRRGIELRPQLPDSVEASQQAIIAVVTRRPWPLPPFDYETGPAPADTAERERAPANTISLRTFQVWLGRIPPEARGVGQALYVVRRP